MGKRHNKRHECIDELSCKLPFGEGTNYQIAHMMIHDIVRTNDDCYFENDDAQMNTDWEESTCTPSLYAFDGDNESQFDEDETMEFVLSELIKIIRKHKSMKEIVNEICAKLPFSEQTSYGMIRDVMNKNRSLLMKIEDDYCVYDGSVSPLISIHRREQIE